VALAEDRDRRADTPDDDNRCYAERAPRRRDLAYQAEYCYAPDFARCSVFLGWAARNAAQPAAPESASAGHSLPAGAQATDAGVGTADEAVLGESVPLPPTPEGGLFGPAEPVDPGERGAVEQLDWVSASAWAEAPWDERAELEAELEELEPEPEEPEPDEAALERPEEATSAPRVPAALPLRRRKPPGEPIRSRGSGEWFYADPPGREPLVSRRSAVTPAIMLAVLGVLVVSVVVFLLAASLGGGDGTPAAASPSPAASRLPLMTRAPATAEPSVAPSSTPGSKVRSYRVKPGDSLSGIAAKFGVTVKQMQCINGILNKDINLLVVDARLQIPPEDYECPPGWRNAAPEP
jgi:LysM repeat protein